MGQEFIRRWQQRNNTNGYLDANGTLVCDPATDDDGEYDMYRQHINYNDSKPYICAGLNFSTFNASNIYLEAAYAYDAMYAAAYALHDILYRQNLPNITGTLLKQALINLDPFAGITGTIQFSNGRTSRGNYGRGDRIHGYLYSIINFNPGSYVDAESAAFDTIGTCSSDGVVSFTLPAIYNSVDGKIPSDDPVGLNVELDAHSVMIYSTCAYVLLALTLFSATFCYVYRASSFIRIAQPTLLAWTLVGVLITLIRQFIIMTTVSYSQCVARIYLFHLSFYAIVGSLTAKMYRLHLMCNVSNHRQTDVSERRAHLYFIIGLGILFFYLVLQTTINPQNVVYDLHPAGDGQFTTSAGCAFSGGLVVMDYILLTAEGFALLYAAYLCVVTRNAPEIVNEFSITSKGNMIMK